MESVQTIANLFRSPVLPVLSLEKARGEMIRKGIHLLVAIVPAIHSLFGSYTLLLLAVGTALYILLEILTLKGCTIPVFHTIIGAANRERDKGKFAFGPLTLGLGAFLSLVFFPYHAACIAIYALAFGDGFASLIGRIFGKTRPTILMGKSVEGSLSCFLAVYISALHLSHDWKLSFCAALIAAIMEALPLKDWDNIIIPLAVGYITTVLAP
ncbi:MAG: phosphatidate cytidylyltransferase [Spirochaetaceae bacterium]|jgi:dolichol kinase|nr:phosphatidate cytidylyltransferase [Spirochaetaceae bacterium]